MTEYLAITALNMAYLNRIRNRVNYVLPSGDGFHPRMVRLKGTKAGDQLVFQRPEVKGMLIYQYTYAYAAVSPQDGRMDSLVLPEVSGRCM